MFFLIVGGEEEFNGGNEGNDIPNSGYAAGPHRPGIRKGAEAEEREDLEGSAERGGEAPERKDKREDKDLAAVGARWHQNGHCFYVG